MTKRCVTVFFHSSVVLRGDGWRHYHTPMTFQLVSLTTPGLTVASADRLVPFISHELSDPVAWWCQRMSGWPSPLKSPTPTIFQLVSLTLPGLTVASPARFVPFMIHALS